MKKLISFLLALVLATSYLLAPTPMPVSASTVSDIQDGVTLHIASAGYTTATVHQHRADIAVVYSSVAADPVEEQTIYFTAPDSWNNANFYSWDSDGEITSNWPGDAMTQVEGNLYSCQLPADAVNIIFNNGSVQTQDLTIPSGKDWYDFSAGTWSVYGDQCTHPGHSTDGNCTECGAYLGHSYSDGICTVCGTATQEQTVYFTAPDSWNNANFYSWDSNGEITSRWPGDAMTQVEGNLYFCQLPADAVNIIFNNGSVQTQDLTIPSGKDWYDFSAGTWSVYGDQCTHPGHSADGNCTECGAYVGHSYENGTCSVCGAADPNYVAPAITASTVSLSFEDEILLNVYFTTAGLGEVKDYGLLIYSEKVDAPAHDNAIAVTPGYYESNGYLSVTTPGIPAKKMGDKVYFAVYAELADGSYFYSKCYNYAPTTYAYSLLSKSTTTQDMKNLVVAMLNYGAAAQEYFGYNTEALVNASLTDEQKAFVIDYNADMLDGLTVCTADKKGDLFGSGNTGFNTRTPSVNFEGAFSVNFYFADPKATVGSDVTFYVWDAETYNSVDTLLPTNATATSTCTFDGTYYMGIVEGIAAKEVDETFYCAAVFTGEDGNTYVSGVIAYSLGYYLENQTVGTKMPDFAQATAVYSYYAKSCFQGTSVPPDEPSVSGTYIVGEDELPYSDEEIYQQLFDPNTKLEINLDMSDEELQKLQDDYERYRDISSKSPIYRLGNLTITMTTEQGAVSYVIKEVGARMKGNTSRTSFYSDSDGIYNYIHFKFDFQETFDDEDYYGADCKVWDSEEARDARKDRTFATLEKLEMRWNKLYDATYLKESYAYEVYRSEGVLAPQCNIGVLDWSGARMGIYTVEEPVDKLFIERYVSEEDAGGDLYKLGWTNEGATFTNTNSIGVEDEDNAQFYVYDLKTNKKTSTHENLINLIDTLNSGSVTKESFASVVDVDSFLRFAAVSYFMGGPDDLRNNYNNCYVYFLKSSGKAVFIPYDYDRCLGINREWNPNGNSMTLDSPYGNGNQQSPLFRYSVDEGGFYTAEYTQVLLEVAENELLTADAFAQRFAVAENLYANQVTPERNLKNAEGRDFSFDLERTDSASGSSNMSFKDYIDAKMTAFRNYMGLSDASGSTCYIRGDFNGWSIDTGYVMEQQGDALVFTLDFDYGFKFKVYDDGDGTWMGAECLSPDTTVIWDTDDDTNIVLEAGNYQILYDPAIKQITIIQ